MHTDTQVVTLVFTIVTGIGVLLQAGVLLGMFMGLRETQKKIHALTDQIEKHVLPLIHNSRGLMEDLTPQVKKIAANLVDVTASVKAQTETVRTVVEDVTVRTRKQTARADGMVTNALNTLAQAGAAVERGVSGPLRQVSGVLNGLRVGIDTLRTKDPVVTGPGASHVSAPSISSVGRPDSPFTTASSPLRSVVPTADTPRPGGSFTDLDVRGAADQSVASGGHSGNREVLSDESSAAAEASAAAANFVREHAAATSAERH